jgi:hypothetical protein
VAALSLVQETSGSGLAVRVENGTVAALVPHVARAVAEERPRVGSKLTPERRHRPGLRECDPLT